MPPPARSPGRQPTSANGGTTPLAGITHAATLLLTVLLLAPLAAHMPLAALAAILFVVAWNMSGVHQVIRIVRQAPRADKAILAVTCLLTVFTDLVVAVNIGVLLAILKFLRRIAGSVEVRSYQPQLLRPLPPTVRVCSIDGLLFFAAVDAIERALLALQHGAGTLILSLLRVPFIDLTALERLKEIIAVVETRGVRVVLCDANPRVDGKLRKSQLIAPHTGTVYFPTLAAALAACRWTHAEPLSAVSSGTPQPGGEIRPLLC